MVGDRERSPTGSFSREGPAEALRVLGERALARASGSPLLTGNRVRLLQDARENYPAWLEAIEAARRVVHFESYIIHEDAWGLRFAEALAARARAGVTVRVLYDWLGAFGKTSRRFWRRLRDAGVEVRVFNPPLPGEPLGWITRDHRKTIVVDGGLAFVTGLCVGRMWVGDAERGIEPWRDTGAAVEGPGAVAVDQAFARAWATAGSPLPAGTVGRLEDAPALGDVALRVVATEPETTAVFRLDHLIASTARQRLWLTDAYFAPTPSYVQALVAAARDGVDVRLLVPGATDIPVLRALSRTGYRPLLEGGVRVFEWNGSMIHAKTAVADGQWARVGSTNLNLASWLSNWELDLAVEDAGFAGQVEAAYQADLRHSTEIVLGRRRRVMVTAWPEPHTRRPGGRRGSAGRVIAGALSLGSAVDVAIIRQRLLGAAEVKPIVTVAAALLILAALGLAWPRLVAIPVALLAVWVAAALLCRAVRVRRDVRQRARRLRGAPGAPARPRKPAQPAAPPSPPNDPPGDAPGPGPSPGGRGAAGSP